MAATALLFGGAAATAWAGDSHDTLPGADTALVQVFVNSEADVDKLSAKYDLAEYKRSRTTARSSSTSTSTPRSAPS